MRREAKGLALLLKVACRKNKINKGCSVPAMSMDINFPHPTQIFSLRACRNDDAVDLLAVGGEHSVDILLVVRAPPSSLLYIPSYTPRPTHSALVSHPFTSVHASLHLHGHLPLFLPLPVTNGCSSEDFTRLRCPHYSIA